MLMITCVWSVVSQLYSVTTLKAEVKEIEDAFVFHSFLEPFTNRLGVKFLQLLVVGIEEL